MNLESHMRDLERYYDERAPEYEELYYRPNSRRRAEVDALCDRVRETFAGRHVLEVACGTGYWTAVLAEVASHVLAVDRSPDMLGEARRKNIPGVHVELMLGDCYALDRVPGVFDAALVNFWISHVPKSRMAEFLDGLHRRLPAGSRVLMADNFLTAEYGGKFVELPGHEDTFKLRTLADGSEHLVLKNYYEPDALEEMFALYAVDLEVEAGEYYWHVSYSTKRT